jgi:hypothetical protein
MVPIWSIQDLSWSYKEVPTLNNKDFVAADLPFVAFGVFFHCF